MHLACDRYKAQLRSLSSQIRNLRDSIAEQTRLQDDMRRGQYRGVPIDPAAAPEVVLPTLQKELKDAEVRKPWLRNPALALAHCTALARASAAEFALPTIKSAQSSSLYLSLIFQYQRRFACSA